MQMRRFAVGLAILGILCSVQGCGGADGKDGLDGADGADGTNGDDGEDGTNGADGADGTSIVVRQNEVAPGSDCAAGGVELEYGRDANGNEVLNNSEVEGAVLICNGPDGADGATGSDGLSSLIEVTAEDAGDNCTNGGQRIDQGMDEDADGELDSSEIDSTTYVCNGEDGTDGTDGNNGSTALVDVTAEPAGANCAGGGQRIDTGIDDDENGTLEAGEIDGTSYVCDGSDGAPGGDGLTSLVDVVDEPDGDNCVSGGIRVDWGIDADGSGTLDSGEVEGSEYVCNPPRCGNGVLDPGEEIDPPVSPFTTISVDPNTCRWDFTGVRQLYCNGTWTWDASSGCGQGDADMFCKLLTDNPNSTATSWTDTTALDLPGFNGNQTSTGVVLNVDRGVTITNGVRYKDDSLLTDGFHGSGSVIADPVCTNP